MRAKNTTLVRPPDQLKQPQLRVRCLSTGRVRVKRERSGLRRYVDGEWSDTTLPVNIFLVEHPDGLCLFDTGQTARAADPVRYFPRWYPFFRLSRFELSPEEEAAPQLRRLGFDPADVRWVVLSHLHTDHVGGLADFMQADVLVSRTEWRRAQGWPGRWRGYLPQYWQPGMHVRPVDYDGGPVGPFPGSFDAAGDGCLLLVPVPGHTPGHMAMLVRGATGTFLCGGDAVMSADDLPSKMPEVDAFCRAENITFLATHDPSATDLISSA
jgi:glyoxylase-like metal-dependent hydrolase (beta-lactamase superfamily II)